VVVIGAAVAWFAYNVTLPPVYAGRRCCDANEYLLHASFGIPYLLTSCDVHPAGYSLFLRGHELLHDRLGLPPAPDAILLALCSALVLAVVAAYAFYGALRHRGVPVSRVALWLLLVHPGLVSYAASPLSDSLTLSLLLLLFACVLRFEWRVRARSFALAAGIGTLATLVVLTRTTNYYPVTMLLAAFAAAGIVVAVRDRRVALLLLPLVSLVAFERLTAPRRAACLEASGAYRFMAAPDTDRHARLSIERAAVGARSYLYLLPALGGGHLYHVVNVPDPFIEQHFDCLATAEADPARVSECFRARAPFVPAYLGKKVVALFDVSHLNPHAAAITTPLVRWWNRGFAMLGFVGLVCLAGLAAWAATRRRLPWQVAVLLAYVIPYLGGSAVFHVEARYGLPLVPPAIVALVVVAGSLRTAGRTTRVAVVAALLVASAAFLAQTVAWDRDDPGLQPLRLDPRLFQPPAPPRR
jgi:hypothetical protein